MLRAVLTLAAVAGLAAPALAAPPSPDPKSLVVPPEDLSKARELVRKLGSEVFTEREDAERDLTAMGRTAREALVDGANTDPDHEIRARSRSMLTRAINLEMKARLDTFLADTEGKYEHDLPGWNRLRATVRGDFSMFGWTWAGKGTVTSKAARELFVEFLNAPNGRKLLSALGSGASDLGPAIASLKQELYYARIGRGTAPRTVTAMEVAVVLFVDSQVSSKGAVGPRNTLFSNVLTTSGVIQATNGTDDKAQALKAILMAWIDTRTDAYEMYSAMNLATNAKNDDVATRVAVRLLANANATPLYRGYAFNTLIRTQSKEHLPAVEKLIGDKTVVTNIAVGGVAGKVTTITLGDMALAAAVQMSGQKLEDYHIQDRFKGTGSASITYTRYSIPDDKREEAVAKWKEWREKNP